MISLVQEWGRQAGPVGFFPVLLVPGKVYMPLDVVRTPKAWAHEYRVFASHLRGSLDTKASRRQLTSRSEGLWKYPAVWAAEAQGPRDTG